MRFNQSCHVHRLLLWTYMQDPNSIPAPFQLALDTWAACPDTVLQRLRSIMKKTYPRLKRCPCANNLHTLNAFLDAQLHCAPSRFMRIPATFMTPMPLDIIDCYISALNSKHVVDALVRKIDDIKELGERRGLTRYIADLGGEDFDYVIMRSGSHANEVRQLHKFMMNCVLKKVRVVVFGLVNERDGTTTFKELSMKLGVPGLRCNAVSPDGDRCTHIATLRCAKCHRAFYCTPQCQRSDTTHAHECDTQTCVHRKSKPV